MTKVLKKWTKPINGGKDFNMPYGAGTYGSKKGRPKKKKSAKKKSNKKSKKK